MNPKSLLTNKNKTKTTNYAVTKLKCVPVLAVDGLEHFSGMMPAAQKSVSATKGLLLVLVLCCTGRRVPGYLMSES